MQAMGFLKKLFGGKDPVEQYMIEARALIASEPSNPKGYTMLAEAFLEKDDLKSAGMFYQTAFEKSPNDVSLLVKIARIKSLTNDWQGAMEAIDQAKQLSPNNEEVEEAEMEIEQSPMATPQERKARFRQKLAKNPEDFSTMWMLATLVEDKEMLTKAIELGLAQSTARDAPFLYAAGETLYALGDTQKALNCFSRMVELNADIINALVEIAKVHACEGCISDAESTLEKAIALDPKASRPKLALGLFYIGQLGTDEGLELLLEGLEQDNGEMGHPESKTARAVLMFDARDTENAFEYIEMILAMNPRDPIALFYRAENQKRVKQYLNGFATQVDALRYLPEFPMLEQSISAYLSENSEIGGHFRSLYIGLAEESRSLNAMSTIGRLLADADYLEAAQNILGKALEIDPSWWSAIYQMGILHMEQGQFDQAEPLFRKMSELSPNNAEPVYMLGLIEQLLDKTDDALATYEAALKIDPNFVRPRWAIAGLQYERNDFLSAIDNLKLVLTEEPDHAKSLAMLGKCYVGLGRGDEAIPYFKKALDLEPFLEDVADELAILEAAKRN